MNDIDSAMYFSSSVFSSRKNVSLQLCFIVLGTASLVLAVDSDDCLFNDVTDCVQIQQQPADWIHGIIDTVRNGKESCRQDSRL